MNTCNGQVFGGTEQGAESNQIYISKQYLHSSDLSLWLVRCSQTIQVSCFYIFTTRNCDDSFITSQQRSKLVVHGLRNDWELFRPLLVLLVAVGHLFQDGGAKGGYLLVDGGGVGGDQVEEGVHLVRLRWSNRSSQCMFNCPRIDK